MADSEGDGLLVRLPHTMNPITRPLWFDRIFLKTLDLWPFEPHAKASERRERRTTQIRLAGQKQTVGLFLKREAHDANYEHKKKVGARNNKITKNNLQI